jgi:hypothetical protein
LLSTAASGFFVRSELKDEMAGQVGIQTAAGVRGTQIEAPQDYDSALAIHDSRPYNRCSINKP